MPVSYTHLDVYKRQHPDLSKGKMLSRKHSVIIKKTKQLFFHKFAAYVLGQTSPLII